MRGRVLAALLLLAPGVGAAARDDEVVHVAEPAEFGVIVVLPADGPRVPACEVFQARVDVRLHGLQPPLVGTRIEVDARNAKILDGSFCVREGAWPLPEGGWAWRIVDRPAGSGAALDAVDTLLASLVLDRPGEYVVEFEACPVSCLVVATETDAATGAMRERNAVVARHAVQLRLAAVAELSVPPRVVPLPNPAEPTQAFSMPDAERRRACSNDGGLIDPQWVTVHPWSPGDPLAYLEGTVLDARVSRMDNLLNHRTQDVNLFVRPDPAFLHYRIAEAPESAAYPERLGMEWETASFPTFAWPTPGDRVSVFGYWILDCGHAPFYAEFHPPVLLATQRARAILLPEDGAWPGLPEGVGEGVHVPGVVTDLWIGASGGGLMDGAWLGLAECPLSGLRQPEDGDCVPGAPTTPIGRVWELNVSLPPSPRRALAEAGHPAPPEFGLHVAVEGVPDFPDSLPDPIVEHEFVDGADRLRVRVDLAGTDPLRYARRIHAAWVYPSPDNWGLEAWRLTIPYVYVRYDGDWVWGDPGDWAFWVDVNSRDREWTKLIDCARHLVSNCVDGGSDYAFGGRPWSTGSADASRDLGPDILLYPGRIDPTRHVGRVIVASSGYEADALVSDSAGTTSVAFEPRDPVTMADNYACTDGWDSVIPSLCTEYNLHHEVALVGPVLPSSLTTAARALHEAAKLRSPPPCAPGADAPCRIASAAPRFPEPWHVSDLHLPPAGAPVLREDLRIWTLQEREERTPWEASGATLRRVVGDAMAKKPEAWNAAAAQLREALHARVPAPADAARAAPELLRLREALPAKASASVFAKLAVPEPDLRIERIGVSRPAAGGLVFVELRNEGAGTSEPFRLEIEADGKRGFASDVPGLVGGAGVNLSFPVRLAESGEILARIVPWGFDADSSDHERGGRYSFAREREAAVVERSAGVPAFGVLALVAALLLASVARRR